MAIGHFNISDLVLLKAVFTAARELNLPVLVGLSEGERAFVGTRPIAAFVRSLREEFDFPIFLNADHTHSLAKGIEAAKAGFDCIVFDLSALPFEDNVRQTKHALEALKAINPSMLIEGEIGDIGTGSEIHDSSPDLSKGLSTPEQAKQFVENTGVDILAPAVGNMHGMLRSMVEGETKKHLDITRIAAIKQAAQVFLTLHGGSGTDEEDFRKSHRSRNQYHTYQHGTARRLEARFGTGSGRPTKRSRALQDSARRRGFREAGRSVRASNSWPLTCSGDM